MSRIHKEWILNLPPKPGRCGIPFCFGRGMSLRGGQILWHKQVTSHWLFAQNSAWWSCSLAVVVSCAELYNANTPNATPSEYPSHVSGGLWKQTWNLNELKVRMPGLKSNKFQGCSNGKQHTRDPLSHIFLHIKLPQGPQEREGTPVYRCLFWKVENGLIFGDFFCQMYCFVL